MEIKQNNEFGLKFPEVKKESNRLKDFLKRLFYKIYFKLPVSKRELYIYLTSTSQLIKAVKDIEAINRTQITGILYRLNKQDTSKNMEEEKKPDNKYERGQYQ